jgi:hypothetical protein
LTETLTERHSKAFFPPLLEGAPPVHFGKSRAASLQKRDARVEMHGRYSSAGSDVGSDAGQSWILGVGGQQLQDCVLLSGVSGGDIEPRAGCAGGPPWSRASSSAVMMSDSDLEIGAETELDLAEYLGGIMPTTAWAGERRPVGDRSGTGSELEVAGDPRGVEAPERTPNTRLQEVLDDISSPESSESSPRTLRGEPADAQNGDVGGVSPPGGTPWHFSAPRHEIIQDRPQRNTATAPIEDRLVRCEALLRARERSVSEQAEQIEALSQKLETMGGERDDMARRCSDWEAAHIRLAEEEQRLQQELSRANSTISVLQAQGSELREEVAAGKLAMLQSTSITSPNFRQNTVWHWRAQAKRRRAGVRRRSRSVLSTPCSMRKNPTACTMQGRRQSWRRTRDRRLTRGTRRRSLLGLTLSRESCELSRSSTRARSEHPKQRP